MTIGQAIKKTRKDKGYTLEALSKKSGIPLSTINAWELDDSVPGVILLSCIADALNVSLDSLIGRTIKGHDAEWIIRYNGEQVCSHCGTNLLYTKNGFMVQRVKTPYCPQCGAKMKEN